MGNQQDAARILDGLTERERAWFWWCPDAETLHLRPLAQDPRQEDIRAAIQETDRSKDAREVSGVLSMEADGPVFVGQDILAIDLEEIADWVTDHHTDAPALARLRGAALRQIDDDGSVVANHQDDALWAGLPAPAAASPLQRAAQVLGQSADGARLWFWMTAEGSDGKAALQLAPVEDDPDGTRFGSTVRAMRLGGARGDGALQGIAQRQGDTLSLTTTVPARNWADIVAALLGRDDAMAPLRGAQLVFLKDGAVKKTVPLPPTHDLCDTVALLRPGKKGYFWFTDALKGHGQEPLLVVRGDADDLKAAAKAAGGRKDGAMSARGRLRVRGDGKIEMQVSDGAGPDQLRAALMGWAKAQAARWPDLRALRGVTITARS